MVCIRNNLKVYTQDLKCGSNDKFRDSIKLQTHDPGSGFRPRFKTFKEKTAVEDGEFDTFLEKELVDHDNCTWLSTGDASSPASCSKDDCLFGYMDLEIEAWFISLLSTQAPRADTILNTKVTFFDGAQVNPIEEASLILDQSKVLDEDATFQENLKEEEVVLWLQKESSDCATPVTDSSDDHSLFSSSSSCDYSSEIMDLEEISSDEPLFWPFNPAADWCSEYKWDFFIISPRKKASNPPNGPLTEAYFETDVAKSKNVVAIEQPEVNSLTGKYVRKHKILLEDLLLVDKLNVEGVIEQVLGLGEFDGDEGIESQFNIDDFSLL